MAKAPKTSPTTMKALSKAASGTRKNREYKVKTREEDCTERELAFVDHFMKTGNASKSASEAGYSAKTAGSKGWALSKSLMGVIQQRVWSRYRSHVPACSKEMINLALNGQNEKIRFEACQYIMNLCGFRPVEEKKITIENKTEVEIDAELKQLLMRNKKLISATTPIDITPTE